MNKKTILIAGVIVVLAGAGVAGWTIMNRQDESANNVATQTDQPKQAKTEQSPKTINGFLAAGKNQKCTFSSSSGASKTSGTMYFASNRMRGEYTSTSDGQTTTGQMIITDGVQYFWEPSSKRGVKLTISQQEAEGAADNSNSGTQGGLDTNQEYTFDCEEWSVEEARFTPPGDVEFMDLSGIQSQLPQ